MDPSAKHAIARFVGIPAIARDRSIKSRRSGGQTMVVAPSLLHDMREFVRKQPFSDPGTQCGTRTAKGNGFTGGDRVSSQNAGQHSCTRAGMDRHVGKIGPEILLVRGANRLWQRGTGTHGTAHPATCRGR